MQVSQGEGLPDGGLLPSNEKDQSAYSRGTSKEVHMRRYPPVRRKVQTSWVRSTRKLQIKERKVERGRE